MFCSIQTSQIVCSVHPSQSVYYCYMLYSVQTTNVVMCPHTKFSILSPNWFTGSIIYCIQRNSDILAIFSFQIFACRWNLKCTIIRSKCAGTANVISSNCKALWYYLSLACEMKVDHISALPVFHCGYLCIQWKHTCRLYFAVLFSEANIKSLAGRNIYVPRRIAWLPALSASLSGLIWWVGGVVYGSMPQIPMKHTWCCYLIKGCVVDWDLL